MNLSAEFYKSVPIIIRPRLYQPHLLKHVDKMVDNSPRDNSTVANALAVIAGVLTAASQQPATGNSARSSSTPQRRY